MQELISKMIAHCLAVKDEKRLCEVISTNELKSVHIAQLLSDKDISSSVLICLVENVNDKLDLCRVIVHEKATDEVIRAAKERLILL